LSCDTDFREPCPSCGASWKKIVYPYTDVWGRRYELYLCLECEALFRPATDSNNDDIVLKCSYRDRKTKERCMLERGFKLNSAPWKYFCSHHGDEIRRLSKNEV